MLPLSTFKKLISRARGRVSSGGWSMGHRSSGKSARLRDESMMRKGLEQETRCVHHLSVTSYIRVYTRVRRHCRYRAFVEEKTRWFIADSSLYACARLLSSISLCIYASRFTISICWRFVIFCSFHRVQEIASLPLEVIIVELSCDLWKNVFFNNAFFNATWRSIRHYVYILHLFFIKALLFSLSASNEYRRPLLLASLKTRSTC